jgi:hypothetical protein
MVLLGRNGDVDSFAGVYNSRGNHCTSVVIAKIEVRLGGGPEHLKRVSEAAFQLSGYTSERPAYVTRMHSRLCSTAVGIHRTFSWQLRRLRSG